MPVISAKIATIIASILAALRALYTSPLFRKVAMKWKVILTIGTTLIAGTLSAIGVGFITPEGLAAFFQAIDTADIIEGE